MTEAASPPRPGTPYWVGLMVHDLPTAQRFYGELFGWRYEPGTEPLGAYVRAYRGEHPVGGLGEMARGLRHPAAWLPYFATVNADATADLVRECGGTLAIGPMDVGQAGRLAIAADPLGAVFGIWQPQEEVGAAFGHRPGNPVWTELRIPETSMIGKFYTQVLGQKPRPEDRLPELDYLTLYRAGRPVAGVEGVGPAGLPHDRGPFWLTYFSVPDVEAGARRVRELGGRVVGSRLSPFGRLVRAADPEGAPFALLEEGVPGPGELPQNTHAAR